jgi:transposase
MLDVRDPQRLQCEDLQGLSAQAAEQVLDLIQRQAREIAFKQAKLDKLTLELARHRAWRFAAKSEAMTAEQRALFEETWLEDEAGLQAQIEALRADAPAAPATPALHNKPRRRPLPEHLRRVEHHHEPADTHCPNPECGRPMQRVGEDVSERLDIVPAEFFVHRHIYGKWVCRCCERLVQEPAEPQIIDRGMPASGLVAHTLISRFVDHLPYYRQETINARAGVHTPRSTLSAWAGRAGAALEPLYELHKAFVLRAGVLHADETTVALLDPGAGKTKRAYVWAYARGALDDERGVIYEFCTGRGAAHPIAFLQHGPPDERGQRRPWQGTLVRDEYSAYDAVLHPKTAPGRVGAGCLAHARRKYAELLNSGASSVAEQALQRIAAIYCLERELQSLSVAERTAMRQARAKPLWQGLREYLERERVLVADGGATAQAIDYSLKHWTALTRNVDDGAVPVDNNHLENLIRPWAMGRKAWLFAGSERAGQRAAMVMSLVHSAKLNGHDPWAYLRDVLARLDAQLNSRLEDLLPHRWKPAD